MKAKLSTAALLSWLVLAGPAAAEEIPHLEFFNRLRQNNLPDLALEYLQKMQKDKTLPKEMEKDFPLEMARLRMEIADATTDPNKKAALRDEARKFYQEYAKANPNTPGAAEAEFEGARVVASAAKSSLTRAQLEEDANRTAALKAARGQLENAEAQLKKATDRLQELLVIDRNPKLVQLMLQSQFESALNLLDQTQTYGFDGDEVLTRADKGKKSLDILTKVAAAGDGNATSWLAKAWMVRANAEMDQFRESENAFKTYFATAKGPLVAPAKRLAHYFLIRMMHRNSQAQATDVGEQAKEWLQTYQSFRDSAEGQEVRYLLAESIKKQGDEIADKNKAQADVFYRTAEQVYKDLSQSEGDYTSAARRQRVGLLVKLRPELTKGGLDGLRNFEDFFLRAQLEMAQLTSDYQSLQKKFEKEPDKLNAEYEKMETQRQKTAVAALDKAMGHIKPDVPESDVVDAKYLYIYLLMTQEQSAKAAEQGDEVARKYSKSSRAGTCGAYALHAYTQAIEQARQQGGKTADLEEKMQSLAEHLVKTWPNDLPADAARHQLGLVAYRTSKFPEACDQLEKISQAYGSYNQTQYLLATAALQADKANTPVPKGKDPWKEVASKAYARIQAPTGAQVKEYEANRFYLHAKVEEAKVLYANKKYPEMDKLLGDMQGRINKLDPKDRDQLKNELGPVLDLLTVYSSYGKSFNLISSEKPDRYKTIVTLLDNGLIDKLATGQSATADIDKQMEALQVQLRAATEAKDAAKIKDLTAKIQALQQEKAGKGSSLEPKLVQALFGFALTANLMEGKTDRAIKILGFIQQSSGGFENQGIILARVVGDIVKLVEDMEKKGNKADYEKTKAQFSAFLEVLAKQPIDKMKPEMIRFLGMSYSALGLHKQAIALLSKIQEPKDEEGLKFYNIVQLMIAREYRLSQDFDKSWEMFNKLQKTDFGKRSLDLRKEKILQLMDQKIYGTAASEWSGLMKDVRETRIEEYNEALYNHIFCVYKFAMTNKKLKPDQIKSYLDRAGKMIVTVEKGDATMGGLRDKYLELLKTEPLLQKSYEAQKKELEKQASDAGAK